MVDTGFVSVPIQSRFYDRLLSDRAFYIFANGSLFGGFYIDDFCEDDSPEDIENTLLEYIDNYPDVFQTQEQTRRLLDEYRVEVEKAAIETMFFEGTEDI
ncbi:hypothetical protein IQ250_17375, partial [Pseudanabaenaceae cyanobacterium LEGE 13415]|nr:hypothetical protein [Pseudanabaenaceae cyanobacterium LEGE 13415]